jgi:hypothetical protein
MTGKTGDTSQWRLEILPDWDSKETTFGICGNTLLKSYFGTSS